MCQDHLRRAFGGLYHCTKCGWNRCSSFNNMHVFRFHEFGLHTPIHFPKLGFFGFFDPLNGEQCEQIPKSHILVRIKKNDGHFAYRTLCLLVISPARHCAYWIFRLLDSSPTRHFAYYLDSSPTRCSLFYQQDNRNKIKSDV